MLDGDKSVTGFQQRSEGSACLIGGVLAVCQRHISLEGILGVLAFVCLHSTSALHLSLCWKLSRVDIPHHERLQGTTLHVATFNDTHHGIKLPSGYYTHPAQAEQLHRDASQRVHKCHIILKRTAAVASKARLDAPVPTPREEDAAPAPA
jgi:hypothetical protein